MAIFVFTFFSFARKISVVCENHAGCIAGVLINSFGKKCFLLFVSKTFFDFKELFDY